MVGHGGSSVGSYLADPTSPIPSHCASIVATSTLRVSFAVFITESKDVCMWRVAPNITWSILAITFYLASQNFDVVNVIITFISKKLLQKHFHENTTLIIKSKEMTKYFNISNNLLYQDLIWEKFWGQDILQQKSASNFFQMIKTCLSSSYPHEFSRLYCCDTGSGTIFYCLISFGENSAHFLQLYPIITIQLLISRPRLISKPFAIQSNALSARPRDNIS